MFGFHRKNKNAKTDDRPSGVEYAKKCLPNFSESVFSFISRYALGIDEKATPRGTIKEQIWAYSNLDFVEYAIDYYMICKDGIRDYADARNLPEVSYSDFLKMEAYAKKNWLEIISGKIAPDVEILGEYLTAALAPRCIEDGIRQYCDGDLYTDSMRREAKQEISDYMSAQTNDDNLVLWMVRLYVIGIFAYNFHIQNYKKMESTKGEKAMFDKFIRSHMDEHGSFCDNDGNVIIKGSVGQSGSPVSLKPITTETTEVAAGAYAGLLSDMQALISDFARRRPNDVTAEFVDINRRLSAALEDIRKTAGKATEDDFQRWKEPLFAAQAALKNAGERGLES